MTRLPAELERMLRGKMPKYPPPGVVVRAADPPAKRRKQAPISHEGRFTKERGRPANALSGDFGNRRTSMTTSVPFDLLTRLYNHCEKSGNNRSHVVNEALKAYLDKLGA